MRVLSVNIGFITNSSSCIYHFPQEVLEDPKVQEFLSKYELSNGYVGNNMWSRSECESFLVTPEQKKEANEQITSESFGDSENGYFDSSSTGAYIVYGDEYNSVTHVLCQVLSEAAERLGYGRCYVRDYN